MIFSNIQDWEKDPAVKQMLVFASQEACDRFNAAYADPKTPKTVSNFPDENGLGAIYKIRAVRNGNGGWDGLVRCGYTGAHLVEVANAGRDSNAAMKTVIVQLAGHFQSEMLHKAYSRELQRCLH